MIDLHMHTICSDGTDSVEGILKKAEELKLDYISITDHDRCTAYEELKNINTKLIYGGKLIPGVEIKCIYKGRSIDLLGYKINTEKMQEWLKDFYKDKTRKQLETKYFNKIYEALTKMHVKLTPKEEIDWNPEKDWASVTLYYDMKKYSENESKVPEDMWANFRTFTKKYCANKNHVLYIDKTNDFPSLEQGIQAIHECEGIAFMPHLWIYEWATNKEEFINDIVSNYKIDGIECYYSTFTEEQTNYLVKICKENNLYMSGGSDYHGENKPDINLGYGKGNLKIEKDIIKNWFSE